MSDIAIRVENLSKRYRIGLKEKTHDTFAGALTSFIRSPMQNLRDLRRLSNVDDENADDIIWALRDVSFEVKRGEVVGVIGRNGAGKSTLLKILSRITEPSSGRVEMHGRVSSLLEVGTGFHPELTGRDNIYLNGTILGMRKAEIDRKLDEIIDFAGIEKFIDTPVKRYSSGMYVRLAFAVAAHLEPEILLVDEVLSVGDAEFQKKSLGKMGQVAKEGRTVLFVSHDMKAVSNICEQVAVFENGKNLPLMETEAGIQKYLKSSFSFAEMSDASGVDLRTIQNRSGTGEIKFTQFLCQNAYGEPSPNLISGAEGFFVVAYERLGRDFSPKGMEVSIIVYSEDGVRLTNLSTFYQGGIGFKDIPLAGQFVCQIPKFPFRTGKYFVELWCGDSVSVFDWIQNAAQFSVVDGDFYGSGKLTKRSTGFVLLEHVWDLA